MRAEHRLRVVIDTNVWISAALAPAGAPTQVVRQVLQHGVPVFSNTTFDELRSRLWRPKFDRWLSLDQRQSLLHDVDACALWVDPGSDITRQAFSRDQGDDAFIHAALAAQAPWLVTGDQDLLVLVEALPLLPHPPLRILCPAAAPADTAFMAAQP